MGENQKSIVSRFYAEMQDYYIKDGVGKGALGLQSFVVVVVVDGALNPAKLEKSKSLKDSGFSHYSAKKYNAFFSFNNASASDHLPSFQENTCFRRTFKTSDTQRQVDCLKQKVKRNGGASLAYFNAGGPYPAVIAGVNCFAENYSPHLTINAWGVNVATPVKGNCHFVEPPGMDAWGRGFNPHSWKPNVAQLTVSLNSTASSPPPLV